MSPPRPLAPVLVTAFLCLLLAALPVPRGTAQAPDAAGEIRLPPGVIRPKIEVQVPREIKVQAPVVVQLQPTPPPVAVPSPNGEPVTLPEDRGAAARLEATRDYVRLEQWDEAVKLLQNMVESREDGFFRLKEKDPQGRETVRFTSARAEADRLLATLPPRGKDFYRLVHEPAAKQALKRARDGGDVAGLTDVATRFRYTESGEEALALLGTYHLDRGNVEQASACFRRLLRDGGDKRQPPPVLLRAALAFQAAGERAEAERVWKLFAAKAGGVPVRLGERQVPVADARRAFDRLAGGAAAPGWPLYRGNLARTAPAAGAETLLEARWRRPLSAVPERRWWSGPPAVAPLTRAWFNLTPDEGFAAGTIPPGVPLVAGGRLVYRSHAGVHAVDLAGGGEAWFAPSPLSLEGVQLDPGRKVQLEDWFKSHYLKSNAGRTLFANSTLGTLSADARHVYAVEDLQLPPFPPRVLEMLAGTPRYFGPLKDALYHNRLRAIDLNTGAVVWEVGGRAVKGKPQGPLDDAHFLGPPLPLGGSLLALVDQRQELRLVCLGVDRGQVLWSQPLAGARDTLLVDTRRRIFASHLAYGEGVLVCPTGTGAVLGFDPLSRSLLWAQTYREAPMGGDEPWPGTDPSLVLRCWAACAPLVHGGRVVLTAPDSDAVHCLDLHTGARLWKADREDGDLYVGCLTDGVVLVVGAANSRALDPATGAVLWRHATPRPCGQGVLVGNSYHLPLGEGSVLALDLKAPDQSTKIMGRGEPALGNLLSHDGYLYAQGFLTLSAYPQAAARQEEIEARLRQTPNDPEALFARAGLRLDRGEAPAAAADLRAALAAGPPADLDARCRDRLFEALTHLLRSDFAAAEKHLAEYRVLCEAGEPAEWRRRLAEMHRLTARGREAQGRPADALRAWLDLLADAGGETLPAADEPALRLRADLWVGAEAAALWKRCGPEQQRELLAFLEAEGRRLAAGDDVAALERFVALTVSLPGPAGETGREAETRLLERLAASAPRQEATALELRLHAAEQRAGGGERAARLLLARAALLTRHRRPAEALECYRRLARDYPDVRTPDGLSASDRLAQLAADRRLLGAGEPARPDWSGRHFKAPELRPGAPPRRVEIGPLPGFDPWRAPDVAPSCRGLRFFVDPAAGRLTVTGAGGEERWSLPLDLPGAAVIDPSGITGYRLVDQVAVLPVGPLLVALDLGGRRVLWTRNLADDLPGVRMEEIGQVEANSLVPIPAGWALGVLDNQKTILGAGLLGPTLPNRLFLFSSRGLSALDPATGAVLWQRSDVPVHVHPLNGLRIEAHGDADVLCLCERQPTNDGIAVTVRRVFRTLDGRSVDAPQGPALVSAFGHFVPLGRRMLFHDSSGATPRLRLYDLAAGKDVWTREMPKGATVLDSATDKSVTGFLTPQGDVVILEVRTGREVVKLKIDETGSGFYRSLPLLADAEHFYVYFPGPLPDIYSSPIGKFGPSLRHVTLDGGWLYAFDRTGGARRWKRDIPSQVVLTERFEDLPILVCTDSQLNLDKRTGQVLHTPDGGAASSNFHTLRLDPRSGTVELVGPGQTLRFVSEKEK
jgi:outer membrane protein assembly factor BamB